MKTEKAEWREWARRRSREVGWQDVGVPIRRGLAAFLDSLAPAGVLVYLAMETEVDLGPLVEAQRRHSFFVTRTPPVGPLTVHPYDSARELHPLGFEQPTAEALTSSLGGIDVAIVPGSAFDRFGVRLGRGRGYFDVLLGRLRDRTLIGVTPEALLVERLPAADHDVSMTHLATEAGVLPVTPRPTSL